MSIKKIDFSSIEWDSSKPKVKSKIFQQSGRQIRVLELSKGLYHPDWCVTGHIGCVIEGEIEIDFDGEILTYKKGDALFIKAGEEEKHIPKPLTDKVILFLVEEVK